MDNLGRYLMIGGVILILLGGLVWLGGRVGLPLGRLPGDIRIQGENGTFYFPLMSSIVVSVLLTVILNIIMRLFKK